MIYLLGSIVLTSYLILALKTLERLRLNLFQSIVFNYVTCALTGAIVNGSWPVNSDNIQAGWFGWACSMGAIFIITFSIAGITAQRINVASASVAYRISLVIPFVFSIYLYNEKVGWLQWIGILLAVIAVILTCYPNSQTEAKNVSTHVLLYLLPAVLFFGSGLMDTLIKYVEQAYLNDANKNAFLSSAFGSAATIGLTVLFIQVIMRRQTLNWRNVVAGVMIGIPNYFSIWCLVKFLQLEFWQSSVIISVNNIGIVLFSTLAAYFIFKEGLSKINWAGVILSVIAIILIAFGDRL